MESEEGGNGLKGEEEGCSNAYVRIRSIRTLKSVQQKEKEKEDEGVGGGIKRERMERAGEEEEGDAPSPRPTDRTYACVYVRRDPVPETRPRENASLSFRG